MRHQRVYELGHEFLATITCASREGSGDYVPLHSVVRDFAARTETVGRR